MYKIAKIIVFILGILGLIFCFWLMLSSEDVKNDKVKIDTAYGTSVDEIKSIISKASDN